MNAGLILAGGLGTRLTGYDRPKQFIEVGGKPLIRYCLGAYEQCAHISLICVVAAEKWRTLPGDYIYASPGRSRQHSIGSGLLMLEKYNPERVVIHDAARPLVTVADIGGVISAAAGYDGATPVLAVTDTVYQSLDGKIITAALNRDTLFRGQTPECYSFSKYLALHRNLSDDRLAASRGSSEIAVRAGLKIALCPGNPANFKITTNADLEYFREIVEMSPL
ncbi:MAG: 2-C-methyl-D-erythritol 4-phosphate cytidylyltransferase [Desulfarculales bacterium]|jgi:2-C-methyl-D-erythritol 4-phosphate cytidylyltransferase|nr:2-C-methyl-D-erythritol 4-phosphate cytidylyltransferase [Desulfarculales bacterium]